MTDSNYKAAYLRQKQARALAEELLETRSRELYDSNQTLTKAYKKLKQQKAHILHQEKLASIGQLSAGVAHEINNPAGYVNSNLNSLKRYIKNIHNFINAIEVDNFSINDLSSTKKTYDIDYILEDLAELVDDSLEGMERVSSIVQSLKDFARPDTEKPQAYSLNDSIKNALKLVNSEIKYRAEVETYFSNLPQLQGNPGSINQVFLNLIVNAAQSMEEHGRITIRTELKDNTVVASVEDTGCGIPEDILNRIFDPFYTTKDIGEGTGLGLSIVDGIVKKHGGNIEITSIIGKGTRFDIFFPVTHDHEKTLT